MISRFALFTLSLLVLCGSVQAQSQFDLDPGLKYQRHTNDFVGVKEPIRELETITREPLFPELPFLKVREGDRIVRAQVLRDQIGKGVDSDAPKKWDIPRFYLVRGGKYASLYVGGDGATLDFSESILPFFRWEQTRANADALFENIRGRGNITIAQVKALDARLQPDYAEYLSPNLSDFVGEKPLWTPGLIDQSGAVQNRRFTYAGFYFESWDHGLCQYRWVLDGDEWTEERKMLIKLPSRLAPPPNIPMQQMALPFRDKTNYVAQMPEDFRRRYAAHKARYDRFFQIVNNVLRPAS